MSKSNAILIVLCKEVSITLEFNAVQLTKEKKFTKTTTTTTTIKNALQKYTVPIKLLYARLKNIVTPKLNEWLFSLSFS